MSEYTAKRKASHILYRRKHPPVKSVIIPAIREHNGLYAMMVRLRWVCPQCDKPRGERFDTLSYDGSRRLGVHGWRNACGHVDKYDCVRQEARENGLN